MPPPMPLRPTARAAPTCLEALGDTASRRGGLRRADGGGAAADAHHAGQHQEGEEGGDVGSKGPLGPASGVFADADEEQGGETAKAAKNRTMNFSMVTTSSGLPVCAGSIVDFFGTKGMPPSS